MKQIAALALLTGGVVVACGGQSTEHDANDGASSGGNGGANGGGGAMPAGKGGTTSAGGSSSGTAGVASGGSPGGDGGTTGLGGSSGVSGTAGGAGEPDFCFEEPESGPCRGAERRYAYSSGPGICVPFTYGGCEGNRNNFATVWDCMAICIGDHPERSACKTPLDCSLMPTTCCGECTYPEISNTVAVANAHISSVYAGMACSAFGCLPCEPVGPNPWLVATCFSEVCVAVDVRETALTECTEDAECVLRGGLGCCEDCQATPTSFVAVNRNSNLREVLCGNSDVDCEVCPTPPPDIAARCIGGRCVANPGTLP